MRSTSASSFRGVAPLRSLLVATMVLLSSCAGAAAPATTPAVRPPSLTAERVAASPAQIAAAAVPADLVGTWSSAEGNAEIAYKFLADGRFRSVKILNQIRPGGVFEFRLVQDGTAEVAGDRLLLRPTQALKSIKDPDDPARSYTDQPASLDPESYVWRITGSTLVIRGDDGIQLDFDRQP